MCNYLAWFRAGAGALRPGLCADYGVPQRASNAALALATVSHESYHVLGYRLEKQVECYGMQSIWYVATSLGASVAEGAAHRRVLLAHDVRAAPVLDADVLVGRLPRRGQVRPAPRQSQLAELERGTPKGAEAPRVERRVLCA